MNEALPKVSEGTFFYKRVFPAFWFGILAMVSLALAVEKPIALFHPLAMAAFGVFLFRRIVWDLADEVLDGGTYLLVRKGDAFVRVELRDIMNVGATKVSNPRRVTLKLRTLTELGDEIVFIPIRRSMSPFARNAFVDELIVRVDAARLAR